MTKGEIANIVINSGEYLDLLSKDELSKVKFPIVYEVEMKDFIRGKETWDFKLEERVDECNRRKELGNSWFRKKEYSKAIRKYDYALDMFSHKGDIPPRLM